MKKICCVIILVLISRRSYCWGFYMHEKINYHAVFLLPPQMMILFKPNIGFLTEHAVDPDKRRYISASEGAHHYLDIDHYGRYPFPDLPRDYKSAQQKYSEDSLRAYGIVPWWIQIMMVRLTKAFREKDKQAILKTAAELGHYIGGCACSFARLLKPQRSADPPGRHSCLLGIQGTRIICRSGLGFLYR